MQKITPFLSFQGNAEDAMNFYVSVFRNATVSWKSCYGEAGPGEPGSFMTGVCVLDGQEYMFLNGGPDFSFTPATSFMISCDTQEEIDHYWQRLGEGGVYNVCGWLTDKFGVTWQVTPSILLDLLHGPDPAVTERVMRVMMTMAKLEIAPLQAAAKSIS